MNIGMIGTGNMGSAMLQGLQKAGNFYTYDIAPQACEKAAQLGAHVMPNLTAVVREADMIIVAVKPQFLDEILEELRTCWTQEKVLISVVAGKSLAFWQEVLGIEAQIARVMPNTPAKVAEGMTTVCFAPSIQQPQVVMEVLQHMGQVMEIRENVMDIAAGVAGCGPAFVYLFIEAMADAGVAGGLFREQAYQLAAQTVLGAAKMVLETEEHPASLKDAVCSPGGTTIRGVLALEKNGLRHAVQEAILATMRDL